MGQTIAITVGSGIRAPGVVVECRCSPCLAGVLCGGLCFSYLLPLCLNNFPKTLDNEQEPPPETFTPWHDQKATKPHYESRLIKNLSLMNSSIRSQSVIEQIDISANASWDDTSFIDIQIPL